MTAIVDISGGPFAAGASLFYAGRIVDGDGVGIPASQMQSLTLTISNPMTGDIINGVDQSNILNAGRGALDEDGNMTITLLPADTSMTNAPVGTTALRSLIIDWLFGQGVVGRHQVNLSIVALAGN